MTIYEEGDIAARTTDLKRMKDIPILFSVLQESLRHRSSGAGARLVLEDTLVDDNYLLKKDLFLMIPNHELHFSAQAWGSTAQKFSGERFSPTTSKKIPSGAFRGFGGGVNLCPGRFFVRYDIQPVDGLWVELGQNLNNMSLAIAPPKRKNWGGEVQKL
jgi:cytochrome P450